VNTVLGEYRCRRVVARYEINRQIAFDLEETPDIRFRVVEASVAKKSDPIVVPRAAEKLKMDLESLVYEEAVNHLLESDYLERIQNPSLGTTIGTYRLTQEGLARAEELRGV
jgi:hypothetical protein